MTAAVEPLEPGGNADVSLVIAQGYEDVVVLIGFDQIFQFICFKIEFSGMDGDGLAKLRTLRFKHCKFVMPKQIRTATER